MLIMDLAKRIFGTKQDRDLKAIAPIVKQVNNFEAKMKALSDSELRAQTDKFKLLLKEGKTLESILPEAFATVREASVRTTGLRHFDVQILGGIVLHQGKISEMKTGEGKTLCATLPMYLNTLSGKGAHLVTVNDYLAQRDAREMGVIYNFLGLTVGCIIANMEDRDRQVAYNCDITYGTNNEFAFDYLRDNMKFDLEDYVQRGHNFCIVDEVDSILIDEARTPLLISGPSEGSTELYGIANKIVKQLSKGQHYNVDEKSRTVVLTDDGVQKIQSLTNIPNLFEMKHTTLVHHINQSLKAWNLFTKDVDYVVKEDKVVIVDEFTGRLKEGSRWSDGLHQSVEAKENVKIKSENQTLASITFQNYFRLYSKLAGMTGTADTEAEEFRKIYSLDVVVIPTNLPMVRDDTADTIYKNKAFKYQAVANLIKELHTKGQPALVGTISIESSEILSQLLSKMKIPHNVLNAKHHEKEAEIIADAGKKGAITIATNMAGRGTDIKLTLETKNLGGLYIIGTERHEARRIDNQLRGRSGRQGDPGKSKFFISLEDDLMRIFGSDRIKNLMHKLGMKDDEPIEHKMISNAIANAQKKVESHNFDIRKHLLDYDNVMNEQRKVIYHLRREILNNEGNNELLQQMIQDVIEIVLDTYRPKGKAEIYQWPWNEMVTGFKNIFHTQYEISQKECEEKYQSDIYDYFEAKTKELLENKFSRHDPEQISNAIREVLLGVLDQYWKDHLLNMDHLKEGIGLKAYAQQDPLNAYKKESFELFENMKVAVKRSVVDNIYGVELYTAEEIEELKKQQEEFLKRQLEAHKKAQADAESLKRPITRKDEKLGRNDPCYCGSEKKFKHCHGS